MARFRTPQVVLFSDNVERLAGFYCTLGFTEAFRTPTTGEPIHIDVELDGYRIGIASLQSARDDHGLQPLERGQRAAVILWTDDVDAAFAEVSALAAALAPPSEWLGRLRIAWVLDLDGNPVQLVQGL